MSPYFLLWAADAVILPGTMPHRGLPQSSVSPGDSPSRYSRAAVRRSIAFGSVSSTSCSRTRRFVRSGTLFLPWPYRRLFDWHIKTSSLHYVTTRSRFVNRYRKERRSWYQLTVEAAISYIKQEIRAGAEAIQKHHARTEAGEETKQTSSHNERIDALAGGLEDTDQFADLVRHAESAFEHEKNTTEGRAATLRLLVRSDLKEKRLRVQTAVEARHGCQVKYKK